MTLLIRLSRSSGTLLPSSVMQIQRLPPSLSSFRAGKLRILFCNFERRRHAATPPPMTRALCSTGSPTSSSGDQPCICHRHRTRSLAFSVASSFCFM